MFFESLAECSLVFILRLPAIYNRIIPPKSESTHVTPVREQGP
ncbi:hypothetical protein NP493_301g03001 [Ridgeia piscesae]|uniref:Uncharacterized protein n=1 Tax=Ridgeia piscesae TaxID=27915 RepID=A0AAD9L5N4_RIDPI|nr:hypothetical protein NP493_301g03001 [Ridgeia piscesae]